MPKLRAVHFSRVGHPAARLDGVSLHFTPKGDLSAEPCDSVPNLENGGGKTSLIDLLFSCVIPNKNEFAGKTRDGGDRTFDQYFLPNELCMIVTEWSLGEGMPIRVVGQCVYKKTLAGTDEDRRFFSFLVTKESNDYQVTDLPLRQFQSEENPGTASSAEAFISKMRLLMATRSHQQLEVTDNQRKWAAGLRSWGIEPDVYRLQIALNKNEGGSKAMAKENFGDDEKLIGLVTRLCSSDDSQSDTRKMIDEHRNKLALLPQKELEHKMWTLLRDGFADLIEPGNLLQKAEKDFSAAEADLKVVAKMVIATPQVLHKNIAGIETRREAAMEVIKSRADERLQLQCNMNWVARHAATLEVDRKEEALNRAVSHELDLDHHFSSLKAQNYHLEVLQTKAEEDGVREAIAEAAKPAQDIARRLHGLGVKLTSLYDIQQKATLLRQKEAEGKLQKKKNRHNVLTSEISDARQEKGTVIADLKGLGEWLADTDVKFRRLIENGAVLTTDANAAEAFSRSEGSVASLTSKFDEVKGQIEGMEEEKGAKSCERDGYRAKLDTANSNIEDINDTLEEYGVDLEKISLNTVLCEFLEVDSLDPYRPSLPEEIDVKLGRLRHDIFKLEMEQRRDKSAQDVFKGGYPLALPQEDVWSVVDALKAEDVPAFTYVQYLCENNFTPEAIRDLLRKDPARYGGVCITHKRYLAKADQVAGELPSLRGPVQITPVDLEELDTSLDGVAVSLPADDATYNLESAQQWANHIQETITKRQKNIDDLEEAAANFTQAQKDLSGFNVLWSQVKIERIESELAREKENAEMYRAESQRLDSLVDEIVRVICGLEDQNAATAEEIRALELHMKSLESFIEEYESKQEEKSGRKESLLERQAQLEAALEKKREELALVERDREGLVEEIIVAKNAAKKLEEERKSIAFADKGRCSEEDLSREEDFGKLRALYDGVLKTFEEETEGISLLEEQLKAIKKILAEREKAFGEAAAGVPEGILFKVREDYPQGASSHVLKSAAEDLKSATEQIGDARAAVRSARDLLAEHDYSEEEVLPPSNSEELSNPKTCSAWMKEGNGKRKEIDGVIEGLEEEVVSCNAEIKEIEDRFNFLNPTINAAKKHLDSLEEDPAAQGYVSVQEAIDSWSTASSNLTMSRKAQEKQKGIVEAKSGKIIETVNSEAYSDLAPVIRRRINDARATLYLEAQTFFDDTINSLASTEYTLRETKQHETNIVEYLFDDVREVKTRLKDLENISVLPENNTDWSRWSNQHFFKVSFSGKKADENYIKSRIEEFLQKLLSQDSLPSSGLAILQGAAKYALKDITRVRTMKPNKIMDTQRYSLEEAAAWSGGEGLTYSAVALMVFSRLVAYVNATKEQGGGILLVDNPFGSCNLIPFLKLQRIVARLLNMQLIYPTALRDLEAISVFPNVLAFKKIGPDELGREHVRPDEEFLKNLESVHLTINAELMEDA